MRHGVFGRKLSRDTNSRKALLRNLTNDLILREHIVTTVAKAKFVQSYAEKIITSAKQAKLARKRMIASGLTKGSFIKLIEEIAPGFDTRAGGYTRIIKLSPRNGDNAPMAKIELVSWDKSKTLHKKEAGKKIKDKSKSKSNPKPKNAVAKLEKPKAKKSESKKTQKKK